AIVGKALEKNPEKRFKHVKEMLAMLPSASNASAGGYHDSVNRPTYTAHATDADQHAARDHFAEAKQEPEFVDHIEVIDDEPVWRWVRGTFQQMSDAWHQADLN